MPLQENDRHPFILCQATLGRLRSDLVCNVSSSLHKWCFLLHLWTCCNQTDVAHGPCGHAWLVHGSFQASISLGHGSCCCRHMSVLGFHNFLEVGHRVHRSCVGTRSMPHCCWDLWLWVSKTHDLSKWMQVVHGCYPHPVKARNHISHL